MFKWFYHIYDYVIAETFSVLGMVAECYSFVWKTIFWSRDSQRMMSGNFMLKIPNEPCKQAIRIKLAATIGLSFSFLRDLDVANVYMACHL